MAVADTNVQLPEEGDLLYLKPFGLKDSPFQASPNPAYAFANSSMIAALQHIRQVALDRTGLGVIEGEIGLGKTTLAHTMGGDFISREFSLVLLTGVPGGVRQTEAGVMRAIATELNMKFPRGRSSDDIYRAIAEYAFKKHEEGKTTVLILDDAHELRPQGIRALLRLLNLQTQRDQIIQVLLFGQSPEMEAVITSDRAFHSRLAARVPLQPLTLEETGEMLRHRLKVAGRSEKRNIFTPDAITALHEVSRGIPRLICRTAHFACNIAALNEHKEVTADHIAIAAQYLAHNPKAQLPAQPEAPAAKEEVREPEAISA